MTLAYQHNPVESESSNPRAFELLPGRYRVKLKAIKLPGRPAKEIEVTVQAGQVVERTVDLARGRMLGIAQ